MKNVLKCVNFESNTHSKRGKGHVIVQFSVFKMFR